MMCGVIHDTSIGSLLKYTNTQTVKLENAYSSPKYWGLWAILSPWRLLCRANSQKTFPWAKSHRLVFNACVGIDCLVWAVRAYEKRENKDFVSRQLHPNGHLGDATPRSILMNFALIGATADVISCTIFWLRSVQVSTFLC
jgi:hypothetical protein